MLQNQIKKLRDRDNLPIILLLVLSALLAFKPIVDHDFWWHLAAGRWMWLNKSFITSDPFSYTFKDAPWTSITWGYELIIYWLSLLSNGHFFNSFFHMLLALGSLLFTWKSSEILLHKKHSWLAFLIFTIGIFNLDVRWVHRPELITHFCAAAMLYLLLHATTWPKLKPKQIWWIPFLQILWTNGHGIFLMGPFMVWGFYANQLLLDYWHYRKWNFKNSYLKIGLVTTAICFLNPRGISGVLFPLHLMKILNDPFYQRTIPEATNPLRDAVWAGDTWYFVIWTGVFLCLLIYNFLRREQRQQLQRVTLFYLAFTAILIWFSIAARRNISLYILLSLPAMSYLWGLALPHFSVRFFYPLRRLSLLLFAILFTAFFTSWYRSEQSPYRFTYNRASAEAPANARRFIEKNKLKFKTFNNVETGNYMLGHISWFEPFIDSRFAEVYSADHFKRYMDILAHPNIFDKVATQYNFEMVVLSYNPPLARGLIQEMARNENWSLIFVDEVSVIFLRRDILLSQNHLAPFNRSPSEILRDSLAHLLNYPPRSPWWNYHQDYDIRIKPLSLLAQAALMIGSPDVAESIIGIIQQSPTSSEQIASLQCSLKYLKIENLASQKNSGSTNNLQSEFSELVKSCEEAKTQGDHVTAGMILGLFYFNTQSFQQAATEFKMIVKRDPISYEAQLMLAQTLGQLSDWQAALPAFQEAVRLRPQNVEAAYKAAELCQRMNHKECALQFLQIAYTRDQNPQTQKWIESLRAQ